MVKQRRLVTRITRMRTPCHSLRSSIYAILGQQEAAMANDDRDILDVLKFELQFLEKGGYGRSPSKTRPHA